MIYPTELGSAALADHRASAMTAEQLRGKQIIFFRLVPCPRSEVVLEQSLYLIKQVFVDDRRYGVLYHYICISVHPDIFVISQYPGKAVFVELIPL
jgi:hypothetical protein